MTSLAHFETLAGSIELPGKAVIDGKLLGSVSGETFDNVGPRDGRVLNKVVSGDTADVDIAVAAARTAFEDGRWRNLHYRKKKDILFKLADLMERDAEDARASGKPRRRQADQGLAQRRHPWRHPNLALLRRSPSIRFMAKSVPARRTAFRSPCMSRSV